MVGATAATGENLNATPGATVTVTVDYTTETRVAYNVLAETKSGNDANTVMAGAHLDSVQDGAGINDNGTGSAALLETAIQMSKTKPNNTVRFAWWGAEEEGLLGSEYYVENLSDEEADDISLYLNFDMIGSPNYFFGVYDGDDSSGTATVDIPEGSAAIEDVFEGFYDSRDLPYQDTDFSGRSDYGPFIAVGIPAGGLFTGAEGVKTADEAILYGGLPGEAYDPCYHAPCDNLTGEGQDEALYDALDEGYALVGNVNTFALDVNSDALATAVITFAFDTSTVNDVRAPGKSHGAGQERRRTRACSAVAERECRIGPVTSNRGRAGHMPEYGPGQAASVLLTPEPRPPSTVRRAPVVNVASKARNITAVATSSTVPCRPIGVVLSPIAWNARRSVSDALRTPIVGVSMNPGATTLTRIARHMSSVARVLANASVADLAPE